MGNRFVRRPSPAMAVASTALFVALGGVSYGVATGSIDSREIKNNSVRGKDIRNSSVSGRDVANNRLTGRDILESRLGEVPIATDARNAGNAQTVGGIGANRLVRDVEYRTGASTDTGPTKQVFINCPAGKRAIGGGSSVGGTDAAFLQRDLPIVNNTQWFGQARSANGTDTNYTLSAVVVCAVVG